MSRKHDDVYGGIGSDLDAPHEEGRAGARFLKRSTALAERAGGALEEKTLRWVDPAACVMWERHNRAYGLLTEANCRDLIDGIRSQGRQEFPAIVRRRAEGGEGQGPDHKEAEFEVICGARRHFAVSWLRAHGYTQFRYLVEVRDLTDEEAFRLSDIENRGRADISDYERAKDYGAALGSYYGGSQKAMAERLEVSEAWLSRYLALAKLPDLVVEAYGDPRELKEAHARRLAPLLKEHRGREILAEARAIAEARREAAEGRGAGAPEGGAAVTARLLKAAGPAPKRRQPTTIYRRDPAERGLRITRRGRTLQMELPADASRRAVEAWLAMFVEAEFSGE